MFPAGGGEKEREIRPKKTGLISVCARQLAWPGRPSDEAFGRVPNTATVLVVASILLTLSGCSYVWISCTRGRLGGMWHLSALGARRLGLLSAVMWKRQSGLGWERSGNVRKTLSSAALCTGSTHNYRQEAPARRIFV